MQCMSLSFFVAVTVVCYILLRLFLCVVAIYYIIE